MDFDELRAAIEAKRQEEIALTTDPERPKRKLYPEGYVFDEDKSVAWNREEVKRQNANIKRKCTLYEAKYTAIHNEIRALITNYIIDECHLPRVAAEMIYSRAYEDGHSEGFNEVAYRADDLADFVGQILDAVAD